MKVGPFISGPGYFARPQQPIPQLPQSSTPRPGEITLHGRVFDTMDIRHAVRFKMLATSAGVNQGLVVNISDTTPDTLGAATLVRCI